MSHPSVKTTVRTAKGVALIQKDLDRYPSQDRSLAPIPCRRCGKPAVGKCFVESCAIDLCERCGAAGPCYI